MRKEDLKIHFFSLLLTTLLIIVDLVIFSTPVFAKKQTNSVFMGGADPSGGEGEKGNFGQLKEGLANSFYELPFLFHRIKLFMISENDSDQNVIENIEFLKTCYGIKLQNSISKKENNEIPKYCKQGVFKTINEVITKFENKPNFVDGDCPSEDKNHKITDMSIDSKLNLCVSRQLSRYPKKELNRQTLSLLAHEISHALGFKESKATEVQQWVIQNENISFISPLLSAHLERSTREVTISINILAKLLGDRTPTTTQRVCELSSELYRNFDELQFLYNSDEEGSLIKIPINPLLEISEQIGIIISGLLNDYCIQKLDVQTDPLPALRKLQKIMNLLDFFQANFSLYTFGIQTDSELFPMTPDAEGRMSLFLGLHDQKYKKEMANQIACNIIGDTEKPGYYERGSRQGVTYTFSLASVINDNEIKKIAPEIGFTISYSNNDGGVAILLVLNVTSKTKMSQSIGYSYDHNPIGFLLGQKNTQFVSEKTSKKLEQKPQEEIHVVAISSNANEKPFDDFSSASYLIKVLGHEKLFETKLQLYTNESTPKKIGPDIKVICTAIN